MNKILEKKWFIAQIKPNSYHSAIKNLEQQGFETFLPKIKITQRQVNKFVVKNVNVFPGYMFVGFDPDIISWSKINSTYGVSKILISNNKPAVIPTDLILELKIRYEENFNPIKEEKLKKGDIIKFHNGPFVDIIAKIESLDEKNRIWVLLEVMGNSRKVKIQQTKIVNFSKI